MWVSDAEVVAVEAGICATKEIVSVPMAVFPL